MKFQLSATNSKICSIAACERTPSFKERHPKFRKSAAAVAAAACGSTASTPDYLAAARLHRQHSTVSRVNTYCFN